MWDIPDDKSSFDKPKYCAKHNICSFYGAECLTCWFEKLPRTTTMTSSTVTVTTPEVKTLLARIEDLEKQLKALAEMVGFKGEYK